MKLSPRISIRMQTANNKRTIVIVLTLAIMAVLVLFFVPSREALDAFPSWRNVSLYQIVKMHLSARPTHVNQMWACPEIKQPGFSMEDLNVENIKFYEDTQERLKHLAPEDEWKNAFAPALDRKDKMTLMLVYAVFKHAMDKAGLSHIVMHGSAMGAWRHHGITPWDDDIDLGIHVSDWLEIKKVLSCIEGYTLDYSTNAKWSFFKNDGHLVPDSEKRWPFLDIFLYSYDNDYAWGLNYVHLRKFVFKTEDMFPLQFVPFECFMVPVPRHLRKVLTHQYVQPETCVSHHLNHQTGNTKEIITVPCSNISDLYTMYFTDN